ncbi:hypothetical protein KR074_001025 [Drosophila pseudoananassae]|nr:hypothetical protein KR074_000699 [Drosophila pseudoananassae]KAH8329807.1 hypothetical protein KR074_000969 [Drosophila pseudoananassae]KAH8341808.1 hypothetical protein KR074_001025 [Drosophila pseudoananassae]
MAFGDVKTPQGLKDSYISGYTPSKADLSVFDALGKAPAGDFVNVARWYRHIASFEAAERSAWTGAPLPNQLRPNNQLIREDRDGMMENASDNQERE